MGSDPHLLLVWILKEGSNACRAFRTFVLDTFINCSLEILTLLPVKLSLRTFPYPVTTTSSISVTSSFNLIESSFWSLSNVMYFVSYPTKETTRMILSCWGISSENFPLISVTTPKLVSFIKMVAPGKVLPCISMTVPVILRGVVSFFLSSLLGRMMITSFSIS